MCDMCGNDPAWKSEPNTDARREEVKQRTTDTIMKYGHQVTAVTAQNPWFYSVGRAVFGRAELLVTGNIPPGAAGTIINDVARRDLDGEIDIVALADGPAVRLGGDFLCELRFVTVDPVACQMFQALDPPPPSPPPPTP